MRRLLLSALGALPAGLRAAPAGLNGRVWGGRPAAAPDDGLSGTGGTAPAPDRHRPSPGRGRGDTVRAWTELFRVSALFSVPGDALAGAAAVGRSPGRGTALAIGASLCLYEAGMALNDWADREEDAVDRPHRPIPSGRISPSAALGAAGALTAAGLALAARAGRPALAVATGLAATVWAYDLHLKHTKAGPAAMATARSLDLLLGATATATATATAYAGTGPGPRATRPMRLGAVPPTGPDNVARAAGPARSLLAALPAALVLGAHTYGVTAVSRHEAQGGSTAVPLAVLATTTALAAAVLATHQRQRPGEPATPGIAATAPGSSYRPDHPHHPAAPAMPDLGAPPPGTYRPSHHPHRPTAPALTPLLLTAFTGAYLRTAGPPLLHAALNPSPPLTQRAVGGGIRAMIPLQAALAARAGAPGSGLAVMALVPLARSLARKVSPT
ncbi:UbiA family prenyltransferase [Streptomyces microflavus]|uniref:SCO3242 family prenyltransferase n=1 Tax=Streptomyces microflavus TaxID=1919 RepID=UPI0029A38A03|nr:UbiA family prenyltransferase [Streptomyces microflavus]MDX2405998.1 UbiA family prenyltransferase [Streptomyces microflavus]